MDLADRAQADDERAERQARHLAMRQPLSPEQPLVQVKDCEDCGLPLSKMRLQAVPTTTRCLDCQMAFESLQRRGLA